MGCGDSPGAAPPSTRAAEPSADTFRALGYAGWDDVADAREAERGGVQRHDVERAHPWPRIWADDRSTLHVVSADGLERRDIEVPDRSQVEFVRALEGGRLACVSVDEGLTLLEPDGSLVWHFDAAAHHDVMIVPGVGSAASQSRRFALLVHDTFEYRGRSVRFDRVVFVDEATGRVAQGDGAWVHGWETRPRREELMRHVPTVHPLDTPPRAGTSTETEYDYFHANTIHFDGTGALVLCLRNVDLLVRIEADGTIADAVGPGILDWPHAPTPIERHGEARLLVFDNGAHRGASRVVELTWAGDVRWVWPQTTGPSLFSEVRGFVQLLPNGNRLVTESERGRVFEVTTQGDVVWSFENPETIERDGRHARRRIYRMSAAPSLLVASGDG